jgi:hypothetical protein
MNIDSQIRRIIREETNQKGLSLLKIIRNLGLYDFLKDTRVPYRDITSKVDIPRDVKIQYIKDVISEHEQSPNELDLSFFIGAIPLSASEDFTKQSYIEFLSNRNDNLSISVSFFDMDDDEPEDFEVISEDKLDDETLDLIVRYLTENLYHLRERGNI